MENRSEFPLNDRHSVDWTRFNGVEGKSKYSLTLYKTEQRWTSNDSAEISKQRFEKKIVLE
jgi:hypothetical protein